MKDRIKNAILETVAVHEKLVELAPAIEETARRLADVLEGGGAIYVMGNGGSAADAQHMACELVGRFLIPGRAPLPCHALSTDSSILTAIGNDFGVEEVFERQVQAFVGEGDAAVGISTSGNSTNVVRALEEAQRRGALTVALSGGDGGRMVAFCDLSVVVPSEQTPRIQEAHATIVHILCDLVERALQPGAPEFGEERPAE